ncbi:unannotated protein [freshwater metagenome]|uniref:Unannotated protein n=1 Tax=freshwater metagenome TaxID=449393 RepID=A0A6J6Z8M3_9ZZZZ
MDADRTRHLRNSTDGVFDVARRDHHEVVELVDHNKDVRKPVEFESHVGIIDHFATVECGVVTVDIAESTIGEKVIATLHLFDRPRQRVRGLLRVGDDLRQQMRKTVVLTEFHALWVDEDESNLIGRRSHQDRRKQRVDARGLTGTGSASNQDMGHLRKIGQHRTPVDVTANRDFECIFRGFSFWRSENVADRNQLAIVVRHFNTNGLFAGNRGENSNIGRGHRVRDVLMQTRDL